MKNEEVNASFLNKLFYGKIRLDEMKFESGTLSHEYALKTIEDEEKFIRTLSDEQLELWDKYNTTRSNLVSLWYEEYFAVGFKMGAKMM